MDCCKECKFYKELERWTYKETAQGQEVEHITAPGFACLGLAYEGIVINMIGVDENTELCEMFINKNI